MSADNIATSFYPIEATNIHLYYSLLQKPV